MAVLWVMWNETTELGFSPNKWLYRAKEKLNGFSYQGYLHCLKPTLSNFLLNYEPFHLIPFNS